MRTINSKKKEIKIMKKIINGKVYDTGTAEKVGCWSNNYSTSDFGYCSEELYRKRTGEFFLYGEGGPSSKYSICIGNNEWGYGKTIIPLSYDAAREWAEDHLSASEYESIFGEVTEDDSRVTVTLSLSASAVEKAKRAAAQTGMGLSAYIEKLI